MKVNKLFFVLISSLVVSITIETVLKGQPIQNQIMYPTRIPQEAMRPGTNGRLDRNKAIDQFILEMKDAAQENSKIPNKDDSIFRIMTYNVHYWKNPHDTTSVMNEIVDVIKNLNPDVVILQEVSPNPGFGVGENFANSHAMKLLEEKIKVPYFAGCNTLGIGEWFGNVIASRIPFNTTRIFKFNNQNSLEETRCYIFAQTQMPVLEYDLKKAKEVASKGKTVIVEGHACESAGSAVYNMMLSEKRAEQVKKYFVKHGVSEKCVKTVGRGSEMLIVPHGNRAQQAPNRRVEVYAYEHTA